MSNPSILFVTASFSLPESYDPVINAIAAKGYEIRALHLPSVGLKAGVGREEEPPNMYDDATFIAREIEKLSDQGKDVILVAHSYGGVPATEGAKKLGKREREKQGKKGGIVKLGYMTALVPAIGKSAMDLLVGLPEETRLDLKIDEKGWMYHDQMAISASIMFSDLPREEGKAWVKKLAWHSAISFAGELTYAGYKDIPVSYLVCEEDLCFPAQMQRDRIALIEKESGKQVDITSIQTGHFPNASAMQKVIDWILDLAER